MERKSMRGFTSLPRPVLLGLAILLAGATVLYSVLWMYYARHAEPTALLGIEYDYLRDQQALRITRLVAGSPATRAGLLPGDL